MRKQPQKIGLGFVGAGRLGRICGELATRHPAAEWIGIANKNPGRAKQVAERVEVEFVTSDFRKLLKRPEVNAALIFTKDDRHGGSLCSQPESARSFLGRSSGFFSD